MAEPCWINASNKTDLPGKSGIYWFRYCVINIRMEPGCSRIIPEIPLYWSSDEPWHWATVTKTASVAVWCLNVYEEGWESSEKCDCDRCFGQRAACSLPASLHRTGYPGEQRRLDMQGSRNARAGLNFSQLRGCHLFPPYVSPDTLTSFHISSSPIWC